MLLLASLAIPADSAESSPNVSPAITADTPEAQVLDFIDNLKSIDNAQLSLLQTLYAEHKSRQVKDAIMDRLLNRSRNYDLRVSESIQKRFIQWILDHGDVGDHKILALRRGGRYPGVNRFGDAILNEFLRTEQDSELLKHAYIILVEEDGISGIMRVINTSTPADTLAACLDVLLREAQEDSDMLAWHHFGRNEKSVVDVLRELAAGHSDATVRKKSQACVDTFRQHAIAREIKEHKEHSESIRNMRQYLALKGLTTNELAQMKVSMAVMGQAKAADSVVDELRSKFGPLPEEKKVRKQIDAAMAAQAAAAQALLDSVRIVPDSERQSATRHSPRRAVPPEEPSIAELIAKLKSEDRFAPRSAVDALGRRGKEATVAIRSLLELLDNPDQPRLQENIVAALVKIGPEDERVAECLLSLILGTGTRPKEQYAFGRRAAVQACSAVDAKYRDRLIKALVDAIPDRRLDRDITKALRALGGPAGNAVTTALGTCGPERRRAFTACVQDFREPEEVEWVMPGLLELVRSEDIEKKKLGMDCLRMYGPRALPALKDAAREIRHDDRMVRRHAHWVLAAIGKQALPVLISVIEEGPESSRTEAAYALRRIGKDAAPAIPALLKILRQRTKQRVAASAVVQALCGMGPAAYSTVPDLVEHMEATQSVAVIYEITRVDPPPEAVIPALLGIFEKSSSYKVQEGAMRTFAYFGESATDAFPAVAALRESSDYSIRASVPRTLVAIDPHNDELIGILVGMLDDQSSHVRNQTLGALARLGPNASPSLTTLMQMLSEAKEQDSQCAILRVIEKMGPAGESAVPALEKMLEDRRITSRVKRDIMDALKELRGQKKSNQAIDSDKK